MLDWKILAASFAALLIVSAFLVGGAGGFFSNMVSQIGEWLGATPFGGFLAPPVAVNHVSIFLYPENITIKPDSSVNITTGTITFTDFSGEIDADFQNQLLVLRQTGTSLAINLPLGDTVISGLRFSRFSAENIDFSVNSEESDIDTENSSIEISGFSGTGKIGSGDMELTGNATRVKGDNWEIR